MGIIARSGGSFDPVPEAIHHGICYSIYELGTQVNHNPKFKDSFQVIIMFEMPEQRIELEDEDGTVDLPRAIHNRYTNSLNKKAKLRKDLESWRGKRFTDDELKGWDLTKLLGINCNLQVIHNQKEDRVYANINAIFPFTGDKRDPENATRYYSIKEHGEKLPANTPEWVEKIIRQSKEWKEFTVDEEQYTENEFPPDEIPPHDDGDVPF